MAQWVRLPFKPDALYSVFRTHMVEGKKRIPQVVLCPSYVLHGMHTSPYTYVQTHTDTGARARAHAHTKYTDTKQINTIFKISVVSLPLWDKISRDDSWFSVSVGSVFIGSTNYASNISRDIIMSVLNVRRQFFLSLFPRQYSIAAICMAFTLH